MGTGARGWLSMAVPEGPWAWTTLGINIVGCILLAAVGSYASCRPMGELFRVGFGTGFCGAFTTFSTIMLLFVQLPAWQYIAYLLLTVVLCLAAVHATGKLTRHWLRSGGGQ